MTAAHLGGPTWIDLTTSDTEGAKDFYSAVFGRTFETSGPAMDIPGKGRMAITSDPTGAMTGLWQPGEHTGFEVVGAAGSPVWHQLTVTDYRAALDFYTMVFGWETRTESDTDPIPSISVTPTPFSVANHYSG